MLVDETQVLKVFEAKIGAENLEKGYMISSIGMIALLCLVILHAWIYFSNSLENSIFKGYWLTTLITLSLFFFPFFVLRSAIKKTKAGNLSLRSTQRLIQMFFMLYNLIVIPIIFIEISTIGSNVTLVVYILLFNLLFVLNKKHILYLNISCIVLLIGSVILMANIKGLEHAFTHAIQGISVIIPGLLVGGYQYNYRYKTYLNAHLLESQNKLMQTANIELSMKALQSQMNPHFIFNTLNAIQHFLLTNDKRSSIDYLGQFAQLIRHVFQYSVKKTITLKEELDFLNLYLDLEKLRFEDKVNVRLIVDQSLLNKQKDIAIPPLLLQPILENAFKHGLMHKQEKCNLMIHFKLKNEEILHCIVTDNGVGREHAAKVGRWRKEDKTKESGVSIIEKRLAILNSTTSDKANNYIAIIDLYDENNAPSGTKVEVFLQI